MANVDRTRSTARASLKKISVADGCRNDGQDGILPCVHELSGGIACIAYVRMWFTSVGPSHHTKLTWIACL